MATATTTTTVRTGVASAANTAGSTTTGTACDCRTTFGGLWVCQVTNGATGPTIACDAIFELSRDNTNWIEVARATAGTANNGVYGFTFKCEPGTQYSRIKFSGNTAQSVTVEAYMHEFTSIAST